MASAPSVSPYKILAPNNSGSFAKKRKFEERGVSYEAVSEAPKKAEPVTSNGIQEGKKQDPLIVLDGNATKNDLSDLDEEEIESIVVLKEPLYIINGAYYSEKELFDPNPTSPYAPIKDQKIESTTVLSPEKAVAIYGEKGKNGVVIITTKNGKPAEKKK